MLATINNTITIQRWEETDWESSYTDLDTWVSCYIEPAEFDVAVNIDWENTSNVYALFSDYTNIIIWDKLIDKDDYEYKVKWLKSFNDMLWKHIEAIILRTYWEDD